jgi:hypothetical protein
VPTTYGAHYLFTSQWINPALDQPNPGALFPDKGNAQLQRPITESTPYVSPPPAQVPSASWPDRGHALPTEMGALFFATSQRIDPATFQPNSEAIYVDRSNASIWRSLGELAQITPATPLSPPNPEAVFPDKGYAVAARSGPNLAQSTFAPPATVPAAIWPDKGNARPWQSLGEVDQVLWPAPVTPPNPAALYSNRGYGSPFHPDVPQWQWVSPPAVVPSAVYPDRGHAVPTPLAAHVFDSDRWISLAIYQPNPSAIWRDRGYGRPTVPTAHELFQFLVLPPPFLPVWNVRCSTTVLPQIVCTTRVVG